MYVLYWLSYPEIACYLYASLTQHIAHVRCCSHFNKVARVKYEYYHLSVIQFCDPFFFHIHTDRPLSSVTLSQEKPSGLAKKAIGFGDINKNICTSQRFFLFICKAYSHHMYHLNHGVTHMGLHAVYLPLSLTYFPISAGSH